MVSYVTNIILVHNFQIYFLFFTPRIFLVQPLCFLCFFGAEKPSRRDEVYKYLSMFVILRADLYNSARFVGLICLFN